MKLKSDNHFWKSRKSKPDTDSLPQIKVCNQFDYS